MSNNRNPNEKLPGEKPPGKFHYNPGNMSGKSPTAGKPKSEEEKKVAREITKQEAVRRSK